MKKKIIFLFLILIFSAQLPSETLAKGGLIKSIMNFFKGGANNVIKTGDDAIKNMGKTKDEFLERIKSKTTNETISTSSTEAKITENVGRDQHSLNFASLKNTPRGKYIKNLKDKFKGGDELADVSEFFDIEANISDNKSNLNNGFYSLVIINWIGRIYKNSNYFSKPEENKMLLLCNTENDMFYISLLMEQEPKRAFLEEHIRNDKNNVNKIKTQELAVLQDSEEIKIMSTLPESGSVWPSNYFTIYNNQGFEYDYLNLSVDFIKNKANPTKKHKYNCFKATEKGLL